MPCWNCLPVFLIATTALLMDHNKSLILPRDCIYVQVFLWLAASLEPGTFHTADERNDTDWMIRSMVNIIFLSNLSQHVVISPFLQRCQFQHRYHQQHHQQQQQYAKEYLRMIGPSAWISLLYLCLAWPSTNTSSTERGRHETIYFHTTIQRGWWVFGISWLVLAIYTWQMIRNHTIMSAMMNRRGDTDAVEVVGLIPYHQVLLQSMDLRTWYEWSPTQVGVWILSLSTQGDEVESARRSVVISEDDSNSCLTRQQRQHNWQQVVDVLAPEQMAGAELPTLTIQDLRCIMGIPYGTASRLVREIQRLVTKHPPPSTLQRYYDHTSGHPTVAVDTPHQDDDKLYDETSWLPRYFSDYYDAHPLSDQERHRDSSVVKAFDEYDERISEQHHKRAREILKARFGLEMPVMETTKSRPESNNGQPTGSGQRFEQTTKVQQPPLEQVPSPLTELPLQLLESMPPHIQGICQRNPHLLRQVLDMHQEPQLTTTASARTVQKSNKDVLPNQSDTSGMTFQRFSPAPAVPSSHTPFQPSPNGMLYNDDDDDDEDGERTELLRKRRVDYSLYRATS